MQKKKWQKEVKLQSSGGKTLATIANHYGRCWSGEKTVQGNHNWLQLKHHLTRCDIMTFKDSSYV
jgi:hypothetical protein